LPPIAPNVGSINHAVQYALTLRYLYLQSQREKAMTTVPISPQGQITLPDDVLNISTWKNNTEMTLLCLGDTAFSISIDYFI